MPTRIRLHPLRCLQWVLGLTVSLMVVGCADAAAAPKGTECSTASTLTGAGSTFDAPLFTKLFSVYPGVNCGLTVNYYAVGSGAGTAKLLNQLVDFGATDAPLTDRQLTTSSNGPILHIPVTLGAVAISYHLPAISSPLHLSSDVVANIYLGQVTFWDDPSIALLNPAISLPHRMIQVLHRSDGSGTTAIFTRYLSEVSPAWRTQVGAGTSVTWPKGTGEQGSGGVAEALSSTEGSIGYVEWSYVVSHQLPAALIQNAAGVFVAPSISGAQAAAAAVETIPDDLRFYVVNAAGQASYPITGYSWVIVYQRQNDPEQGRALAQLLWWMIHDGQQYASALDYAPLPASIVARGEPQIHTMTCGTTSTPCLST